MKVNGYRKVILWIMCITCLLLVILSFFLQEQCGEGGCDAMRICGYALLLVFSIVRSSWRNPQHRPAPTEDVSSDDR